VASLDLLSKHLLILEHRFDAMLYSNLGNENCNADHIKCSRGPQVPHPCCRASLSTSLCKLIKTDYFELNPCTISKSLLQGFVIFLFGFRRLFSGEQSDVSNQEGNEQLPPPKFSKPCLVVKYKLQSFCPPRKFKLVATLQKGQHNFFH